MERHGDQSCDRHRRIPFVHAFMHRYHRSELHRCRLHPVPGCLCFLDIDLVYIARYRTSSGIRYCGCTLFQNEVLEHGSKRSGTYGSSCCHRFDVLHGKLGCREHFKQRPSDPFDVRLFGCSIDDLGTHSRNIQSFLQYERNSFHPYDELCCNGPCLIRQLRPCPGKEGISRNHQRHNRIRISSSGNQQIFPSYSYHRYSGRHHFLLSEENQARI